MRRTPKYSLHKPSGKAVVKLTIDGRQKSFYLGEYDSPESHIAYGRILADLNGGRTPEKPQEAPTPVSASATVGEVVDWFLSHAKTYYRRRDGSQTTEYLAFVTIGKYLKPYRPLQGCEFSIQHLKDIREQMIREGLTGTGLARSTTNKYIDKIVLLFRRAGAEGLIPPSISLELATLDALQPGRSDAKECEPVLPVAVDIVAQTLPHAPAIVADMARLQLLCGMRPDEVCSMKPREIDRTGDVWTYRPAHHKNTHKSKERIVYIGPEGQQVLTPYLLTDGFCFVPKYSTVPIERRRYTPDSYRKALQRAAERANVGRWAPNQLRHTAATDIRKQFGLEAAQVILGHSDIKVTQRYAEIDQSKGREVALSVG